MQSSIIGTRPKSRADDLALAGEGGMEEFSVNMFFSTDKQDRIFFQSKNAASYGDY